MRVSNNTQDEPVKTFCKNVQRREALVKNEEQSEEEE
jgi:hypothetical protein